MGSCPRAYYGGTGQIQPQYSPIVLAGLVQARMEGAFVYAYEEWFKHTKLLRNLNSYRHTPATLILKNFYLMNAMIVIQLCLYYDGHVLLLQRSKNATHPEIWEPPGGEFEVKKEKYIPGAGERECVEETKIRLMEATHLIVIREVKPNARYICFAFGTEMVDGMREPELSEEHQDWGWYREDKLTEAMCKNGLLTIKSGFKMVLYIKQKLICRAVEAEANPCQIGTRSYHGVSEDAWRMAG